MTLSTKADAFDIVLDAARAAGSAYCLHASYTSIVNFTEDRNRFKQSLNERRVIERSTEVDIQDDLAVYIRCKIIDNANNKLFKPLSSGSVLSPVAGLVDNPITSLVGTAGDVATVGTHAIELSLSRMLFIQNRIDNANNAWTSAINKVNRGVPLKEDLTERLLQSVNAVVSSGMINASDLASISNIGPAGFNQLINATPMAQFAQGVELTSDDLEALNNIASIISENLPEIIPEAVQLDIKEKGLTPEIASTLLEQLDELDKNQPSVNQALLLPEPLVNLLDDIVKSDALFLLSEDEHLDDDRRKEVTNLIGVIQERQPDLLHNQDLNHVGIENFDSEVARQLLYKSSKVRYPDFPDMFEFYATFLIDRSSLLTLTVTPEQWDATIPKYQLVRFCLNKVYGDGRVTPEKAALFQAAYQNQFMVRHLKPEESDKVSEALSVAMRHAPVLGEIKNRHILGYSPNIGYLGNSPSQRAIANLEGMNSCLESNYAGYQSLAFSELNELLATLPFMNDVALDPEDELWVEIGQIIPWIGELDPSQLESLQNTKILLGVE